MPAVVSVPNAIRALSMDAVQKPTAATPRPHGHGRYRRVLCVTTCSTTKQPQWANRDRFVLSNGHGSMLIYSLLHLTGTTCPSMT